MAKESEEQSNESEFCGTAQGQRSAGNNHENRRQTHAHLVTKVSYSLSVL